MPQRRADWLAGGDLGLPGRGHGAAHRLRRRRGGVTRALAGGSTPGDPARFSRLVIDPNRGEDDPTLVMRLYDGSIIPANRARGAARSRSGSSGSTGPTTRRDARIAALVAAAGRRCSSPSTASRRSCGAGRRGPGTSACSRTSTTGSRCRCCARLRAEADLCVGDNEPYSGHLPGDSIDRHGTGAARNVLIEVRNDLIAPRGGQGLGRAAGPPARARRAGEEETPHG